MRSLISLLQIFVCLLRYPLVELASIRSAISLLLRSILQRFIDWLTRKNRIISLSKQLQQVQCYSQWDKITKEIDQLSGKYPWKINDIDGTDDVSNRTFVKKIASMRENHYDAQKVFDQRQLLRKQREAGDVHALRATLLRNLQQNIYGTDNLEMYKVCINGTKLNIELYQNELIQSLKYLYYYSGSQLSDLQKLECFEQFRKVHGGHALFLSGGASLGKFHYGVIKALWECDLLPQVICGTSVGSCVAANLCIFKRDELPMLFEHEISFSHPMIQGKFKDKFDLFQKILKNDAFFNVDQLKTWARHLLEDLTFKELYDKNGWILSIGVTDAKMNTQRICNYLTTPNMVIWSTVVASCSIPEAFGQQNLYIKNRQGTLEIYDTQDDESIYKYVDGCFSSDIPIERIGKLFNITKTIVIQVNPHSLPFVWDLKGHAGQSSLNDLYQIGKTLTHNTIDFVIMQLDQFGIMNREISNMRKFTNETYKGDVQIYAKATFWDVVEIFKNITKEEFQRATQLMYVQTLNQISHIRGTIGVSRELDRYLNRLQKKQKKNSTLESSLGLDTLQKENLISLNQIEQHHQTLSIKLNNMATKKQQSCTQFVSSDSKKTIDQTYQNILKQNQVNDAFNYQQVLPKLKFPRMQKNQTFVFADIHKVIQQQSSSNLSQWKQQTDHTNSEKDYERSQDYQLVGQDQEHSFIGVKYKPKIFRNQNDQKSKLSADSQSMIRSVQGNTQNKIRNDQNEFVFFENQSFNRSKSFHQNPSVLNNIEFSDQQGTPQKPRDMSHINLNMLIQDVNSSSSNSEYSPKVGFKASKFQKVKWELQTDEINNQDTIKF